MFVCTAIEHFCTNFWWNWQSKNARKIFISSWCTHDSYYGRTIPSSCSLQSMAQEYKKLAYLRCPSSEIASNWFLQELHENFKNDCSAFVSAFRNQSSWKNCKFWTNWSLSFNDNETQKLRDYVLKNQHLFEKGSCNKSAQISISTVMSILLGDYKEPSRFCSCT